MKNLEAYWSWFPIRDDLVVGTPTGLHREWTLSLHKPHLSLLSAAEWSLCSSPGTLKERANYPSRQGPHHTSKPSRLYTPQQRQSRCHSIWPKSTSRIQASVQILQVKNTNTRSIRHSCETAGTLSCTTKWRRLLARRDCRLSELEVLCKTNCLRGHFWEDFLQNTGELSFEPVSRKKPLLYTILKNTKARVYEQTFSSLY